MISTDTILETANTLMEKIKAKTPSLSEDLPPRRNLWGDPIVLGGAWGWEMVSPIYVSQIGANTKATWSVL